jgi:hypothetical protein
VSPLSVAATAVTAGLSAGLAVFCWPLSRPAADPVRRLARLTPASDVDADPGASASTARQFLLRLHAPWSGGRQQRRRDAEADRLVPLATDLLAACLASGATPARAAEAVAAAIRPAGHLLTAADAAAFEVASRFQEVAALLRLGGNPVTSWRPLGAEPGLAPVATAAARACLTGAPPAEAVGWAADDLRATRHARGTAAARQAGVRAVAPLTGCFLPAFLLLGVIPIMIGLAVRLLH